MTATSVQATADLSIDGRPADGRGPVVDVPNPATEERLARVALASIDQVDEAVAAARRAGPAWAASSAAERSRTLHNLAEALECHRDELLATVISETGCPIGLARELQVGFPLKQLRWYADAAQWDRSVDLGPTSNGAAVGRVELRPVGVVAAISAYNYPLHLALWKIAPALAAGCTVVAVPSPRAPLAVLLLGALARAAELPPGVLNVLACDRDAARHLTAHPGVDKVSFTGSDAVGSAVGVQAIRDIRRVTLELGGKSAALVLPGADLGAAASVVHPRYARHAGQGCAAPTRILVHEDEAEAFLEASRSVYEGLRVGDPWDPDTVVGPVIRAEHRDRVERLVAEAVHGGARIALGGGRPPLDRGWWVNPVLVADVDPASTIAQDEVFGPVCTLLTYHDVDEAIRITNGTRFGLAAYVFGPDRDAAVSVGRQLSAGTVHVGGAFGLRPDAPFGGMRRSGLGREGGIWGLDAYLEPQHIQVAAEPA